MNHPKDTALIAPFRNVETTVKTLAVDSAVSTERALNAAIVSADITRGFEEYLTLVDQYQPGRVLVPQVMSEQADVDRRPYCQGKTSTLDEVGEEIIHGQTPLCEPVLERGATEHVHDVPVFFQSVRVVVGTYQSRGVLDVRDEPR